MTQGLEPDIFRRSTASRSSHAGPHHRRADATVFSVLLAVTALLGLLDHLDAAPARFVRTTLQDVAIPALRFASLAAMPVIALGREYVDWRSFTDERASLRAENDRLKVWETRARALERQSIALAELSHVVPEPALNFVTARVVSGGGNSAFARGALIDAGQGQGLKPGYPVMSAQGLVGRVIAVGHRSASLLLLTDTSSRIPVVVGADATRAVLEGDNGPLPKLSFLGAGHPVKPGDEVITSGVGGQLPRGLRVGTVVDTGETLRVEPAAALDRLQYVGVLFFDVPSLAAKPDDELPASPRKGFTGRLIPSQSTSSEGALPK